MYDIHITRMLAIDCLIFRVNLNNLWVNCISEKLLTELSRLSQMNARIFITTLDKPDLGEPRFTPPP